MLSIKLVLVLLQKCQQHESYRQLNFLLISQRQTVDIFVIKPILI